MTTDQAQKYLSTAQLMLFCVVIFLIPSNLFLKFAENSAYVHGLLVDYLLPKLYASDIAICALFGLWGSEVFLHRKNYSWAGLQKPLIITALSFFFIGALQIFSSKPLASLWFWLKLIEMFFLASWCFTHSWVFSRKASYIALYSMIVMQIVLGVRQFQTQQSVFPSYLFFGETRISQRAAIAKDTFSNEEKILPYGTTAHPNILAGILAIGVTISLFDLFQHLKKTPKSSTSFVFQSRNMLAALLFSSLIIFYTRSFSAGLAIFLGSLTFIFVQTQTVLSSLQRRVLAGLIFLSILVTPFLIHGATFFTTSPSITRRDILNQAALFTFQKHPLTGSGLNTFTAVLEENMPQQLLAQTSGARFIQPAHHVGLLMLAELGVLGCAALLAVIIVWGNFLRKNEEQMMSLLFATLPFLPLFILDHYLWTQQSGQLLFVVGFAWLLTFEGS